MGDKEIKHIELFYQDKEGRFNKIYDVTNEITEAISDWKVIDKSQIIFPLQMEFTASFVIDEDRMKMANAKDVTPVTENEYDMPI